MTITTVRCFRRISQVAFFFLFFWLILKTNFEVNFNPADINNISLPYPVSLFLQIDPLVALTTLLANGTLYKGLLWSLVILIPTIFIGRFFCGWVCPLGSLNHWVSEIRSERSTRKGAARIESNRYKKYQRIKYYILFFLLAAALIGTLQIGLFDPLSLLARSIGTAVLPTLHTTALGTVSWIKSFGVPVIGNLAQGVYDLISPLLLNFHQAHFHTIMSIGLIFLIVLALNRIFTRFWCRGICPLGAMLGLFSRFAIFGLQKNETACNHCNKCLIHCQGADNPDIGYQWRQPECHLCLNCQAVCPESALQFKFFPNQIESKLNPAGIQKIDISRRKTVVSVVGGIALYPLIRSGDDFEINAYSRLIRPPGSVPEDDFLSRCIRCGQCMRVCPNNALHPTLMESGLEGIWSPILIPRIGYCEPTCTLCGQVCPTGAILQLTIKEKVGDKENPPLRIGTAFIDKGRCLPWAMARACIVCEEWCPTSPKAIYFAEQTVFDRKGNAVAIKQPQVDPDLCTGCGACEYACPVINDPAIYISSIGESRSAQNQILLQRKGIKQNIK
jgi:polyferredoxin